MPLDKVFFGGTIYIKVFKNALASKSGGFMKEIKNDSKGFTLLELLVVVVIIGILAAIALPQYQMAVGKTRFATLKDNARVIKEAMDRYYLAHDDYAENLNGLDIELKGNLVYNDRRVGLSDGSKCYISGNSILCQRKIFNITMEYSVKYKNFERKISCIVYSTDLNDRSNRLCQAETKKSEPTYSHFEDYNIYQY